MTTALVGRCARCQKTFEVAPEIRAAQGVVACPHCGARYRVAGPGAATAARPAVPSPAGLPPGVPAPPPSPAPLGFRPTTSMPAEVARPAAPSAESPPAASPPPPLPARTTPMRAVPGAGALEPGDVLANRYRVTRFIAQGGMGAVYEAADLELGVRVALKTLHPAVASDPQSLERFKREIQLARKITHPNVCRIFDFGYDAPPGARPLTFYTMELVEGETLADRLRRDGAMLPDEVLPLLRQMAEALGAAHRVGVIHRDFKSENVFLAPPTPGAGGPGQPRVVVADFGIARADEAIAGRLTNTGEVLGTPAYMSPEQLEGRPLEPSSDVYSLGLVLYEMLTGRLPFQADTAISTAVKRLTELPPSPRRFVPGLDARWEAAILRCLERQAADRFQSPGEVVEALDPARPMAAVPSIERSASRLAARRKRSWAMVLALVFLVAAGSAVWRIRRQAEEAAAPVAPRRSVAVLGFRNLSAQPESEWLATALAEMLGTELGAGGDLRVVPGDLVARARRELDAAALAANPDGVAAGADPEALVSRRARELLGADVLVAGSFAVVGDGVRLDLRLTEAATGQRLESVAHSGDQAALFDLVRQAGRSVRSRLGVAEDAGASSWWSAPTKPEATKLFAEGIQRLRAFDLLGGRDLLERAVEAEPNNPQFRSSLASVWSSLGYPERALAEAKRALDLAAPLEESPEKRAVEGRYWEIARDFGRAAEAYAAAFAASPDDLEAGLRLAAAQAAGGSGRAALETVARLRELEARSPAAAPGTVPAGDPRIDLVASTALGALGDFAGQRKAAEAAATTATARRFWLLVAEARVSEGLAARALGDSPAAARAAEEARRLFAEGGDRVGVATALGVAAGAALDAGEFERAQQLQEQTLATYREVGDLGGVARTLNNIAVVLRNRGDLGRARQLYEDASKTCRESGDRVGLATTIGNLAAVRAAAGELGAALDLGREALELRRALGDRAGEAAALAVLGQVLHAQGELEAAEQRLERALALRRDLGQRVGEGLTLAALGRLRLDVADLGEARRHLAKSRETCRAASSSPCEADAMLAEGDLLRWTGGLAEAKLRLEDALRRHESNGDRVSAAEARASLGLVSLESGDVEAAVGLLTTATAALSTAGARDAQAVARAGLVRALLERGDLAAARREAAPLLDLAATSEAAAARILSRLGIARLESAARRPDAASQAIVAARDEAEARGLELLRVEAELTAVELGAPLGAMGAADLLETLQREAQARGLGLVGRRAMGALAERPGAP